PEAMSPQITAQQGALLRTSRIFKKIALLTTLMTISFLGYQIFNEVSSDAWKMKPEQARQIKTQYDQFLQESQEYKNKYQSLTSFPRFDQLAEPLFETIQEGVTIEEIRFNSKPIVKNPTQKTFEILVQGIMPKSDLIQLRLYAQQLEAKLQQSLTDFVVVVNDSGLSERSSAHDAAFRLNIKIENKLHGSL
ncbi:MAG: hypothetical protein V4507_02480, partial [Verrucomicrobiota bacterium]